MNGKLDKIVVVDIEATCWDGEEKKIKKNEIIEVGVCDLNIKTLNIELLESFFVKPVLHEISGFCTSLTGITTSDIDAYGLTLPIVANLLKTNHKTRDRIWASYGDWDRRHFERECFEKGVSNPFTSSHINVKTLFALTYELDKEVSMKKALIIAGIPLEGTHHRGIDDAYNIAKILKHLITKFRINNLNPYLTGEKVVESI